MNLGYSVPAWDMIVRGLVEAHVEDVVMGQSVVYHPGLEFCWRRPGRALVCVPTCGGTLCCPAGRSELLARLRRQPPAVETNMAFTITM